jgi:hypothetical protein
MLLAHFFDYVPTGTGTTFALTCIYPFRFRIRRSYRSSGVRMTQGAGHDDVYESNPGEFLVRMRQFLELVERRAREAPAADGGDAFVQRAGSSGGGGGGSGSGIVGEGAVKGVVGTGMLRDVAPAMPAAAQGAGRDLSAPVRVDVSARANDDRDGPSAQRMVRD